MKIDGVTIHRDVTLDAVMGAVRRHHSTLDNPGFCIACGCEADGVEPDAEKYECDSCGFPGVYGAQELLFHMAI